MYLILYVWERKKKKHFSQHICYFIIVAAGVSFYYHPLHKLLLACIYILAIFQSLQWFQWGCMKARHRVYFWCNTAAPVTFGSDSFVVSDYSDSHLVTWLL